MGIDVGNALQTASGLTSAIPYVGTGLQVLGNIYGQFQANKAQKQYDGFIKQRQNDLNAKLNTSQNQNYLDTDSARSALEQVRKNMVESRKATTNAAIQGGATPEAVIATEGNLNDKYQNAIGSIVSQGEQLKQRDKYMYEGMGQTLDNAQANSLAGKVNQWGQFGQNVGGAASGIMNAWANGAFDAKPKTAKTTGLVDPNRLGGAESQQIFTA